MATAVSSGDKQARNRARRIRRMLACLMRYRIAGPKPMPTSSH